MDPAASVEAAFRESIRAKRESLPAIGAAIVRAAELIAAALAETKKVLCCGNGGSAADAQHFSGELLNRFLVERPALPAIALTAEACAITAIANDEHYDQIFAKQVHALGRPGDVLLAISTSGNSANVVNALRAAHERSMASVLLTGRDGGALAAIAGERDVEIRVPSQSTPRIQEVHILVLHCLCELIDDRLFPTAREAGL